MAKEKKQSTKTAKPAKNLSKVTKRRKTDTETEHMAEMVIDAFNEFANKDGISLSTIKKHIAEKFYVEMSENNKMVIKKCIGKGFSVGKFVMADEPRGGRINYSKRLRMVDEFEYETERESDSEYAMETEREM